MTPGDVIAEVRKLVQDTRAPVRYSDELLLGFVNQTLQRMVSLRPDLFAVIDEVETTAGSPLQTLPDDAVRLVEIFNVVGGAALTEVSWSFMNRTYPLWTSAAPGTPINYMRHLRNPTRFFLYPRPAAGVQLVLEYAKAPPAYTLDQDIEVLKSVYFPAIVDGTVFLTESIDNEHSNSGRAQLFQTSFAQLLGVSLQARVVTDTETSGMDPAQVT